MLTTLMWTFWIMTSWRHQVIENRSKVLVPNSTDSCKDYRWVHFSSGSNSIAWMRKFPTFFMWFDTTWKIYRRADQPFVVVVSIMTTTTAAIASHPFRVQCLVKLVKYRSWIRIDMDRQRAVRYRKKKNQFELEKKISLKLVSKQS